MTQETSLTGSCQHTDAKHIEFQQFVWQNNSLLYYESSKRFIVDISRLHGIYNELWENYGKQKWNISPASYLFQLPRFPHRMIRCEPGTSLIPPSTKGYKQSIGSVCSPRQWEKKMSFIKRFGSFKQFGGQNLNMINTWYLLVTWGCYFIDSISVVLLETIW